MASRFGVSASKFTPVIWIGKLAAKGDRFLDKSDETDPVLGAVALYVQTHFGGGLAVDFPSLGLKMTVRVKPIEGGVEKHADH